YVQNVEQRCNRSCFTMECLQFLFWNIHRETLYKLEFETENGTKTLDLRSIVYHGQYHFTSCIISSQKQVWYHDGMTTGKTCSYDGMLNDMTDNDLSKCRQRYLSLAVYTQKL